MRFAVSQWDIVVSLVCAILRIPAPGLSFTQPNLPFLIQEIEQSM